MKVSIAGALAALLFASNCFAQLLTEKKFFTLPQYTTAGGKTANVRVKRVDSGAEMIRVWGTHERLAVRRV